MPTTALPAAFIFAKTPTTVWGSASMCEPMGLMRAKSTSTQAIRGGAQSFDAVAGAAVGANDSLLLGFGENVHHAFVTLGPIGFGKAMHKADVEVVGAEFAAEAVEIGAGSGGIAGPGLCEDGDFVALHVLERFGDVRMAAIGIGGVKKRRP